MCAARAQQFRDIQAGCDDARSDQGLLAGLRQIRVLTRMPASSVALRCWSAGLPGSPAPICTRLRSVWLHSWTAVRIVKPQLERACHPPLSAPAPAQLAVKLLLL